MTYSYNKAVLKTINMIYINTTIETSLVPKRNSVLLYVETDHCPIASILV